MAQQNDFPQMKRTRISVFDLIRIENGAMTTCPVSVLVRLMGELGYDLEPVNRSKEVKAMDKERQQMVQLMGKTVGHVFEELDIVYRQHPEVQNDKHFHTALALLQGIQCMTWELEAEEKPPAGETADGQTGKGSDNVYPSLF